MVLPWLMEIFLTVLLLWFRPRAVPCWAVGLALMFNAVNLISTALVQIPIQMQLEANGLSLELIDKLLATDTIRWTFGTLKAFLYLWMMSLVVHSRNSINEQSANIPEFEVCE